MVFWYQWDYLRSPAKILFCRVSGRLAMVLNWMIILLAVLNRVGWTNVVPTGGETPSMEFLWDFYVDQWFWAGLVGNSWQFQPGFYLPSVRYGWWDTSIVPSTASLPYPYFLADHHRSPCHKQTGMFLWTWYSCLGIFHSRSSHISVNIDLVGSYFGYHWRYHN